MSVQPIKRSTFFYPYSEEIEPYQITLPTNSIVEYLIRLSMPRHPRRPADDVYLSSIELSGADSKCFDIELIEPSGDCPTSFNLVFKSKLWGSSDVLLVMKLTDGVISKRTLKVEVQ
ncbi:hypothetical protein ADT30_08430 [Xylella fastidiosa]|nr:hypothetical protein ADT30_08430 [Xylella fastidiosa]